MAVNKARAVIIDPETLRELWNVAQNIERLLELVGQDWSPAPGPLLRLASDDCEQVISLDWVILADGQDDQRKRVVVSVGPRTV
jgi:hypothetical protein